VDYFCVRVNDATYVVKPEEDLNLVQGDSVVILDPKTNLNKEDEKLMRVDLRGFQAEASPYPLEDRGHLIRTDIDLQPKYGTVQGGAGIFPLQAKLNGKVFGQCYIAVAQPKLDYLVVRGASGGSFVLHEGDKLAVPGDEVLRIVDVRTNVPEGAPLMITMSGRTVRWQRNGSTGIDASKLSEREIPLDVTRNGRSLGRIWVSRGKEYLLSSGGRGITPPLVPVRYMDGTN
jgi:hypothetical protein